MKQSKPKISLIALSLAFLANTNLPFNAQAMVAEDLERVSQEQKGVSHQTKDSNTREPTQTVIDLDPDSFKHRVNQIYDNFFVPDIDTLEREVKETYIKLEEHCRMVGKEIPQTLEDKLSFQEDAIYITLSVTLDKQRQSLDYRKTQREILLHTVQEALDWILKVLYTHPNLINVSPKEVTISDNVNDDEQQRHITSYAGNSPIFSQRISIDIIQLREVIQTTYNFLNWSLPRCIRPSMPFDMAVELSYALVFSAQEKDRESPFQKFLSSQLIEGNRIQAEEAYKRETWSLFCTIVEHHKKRSQSECIDEMIAARLNVDTIINLNWSPKIMLRNGWTAAHMLRAGWTMAYMQRANWVPADLEEAGWTKETMEQAGWTPKDMIEARWSGWRIVRLGWSAKDFISAGYNFQDLLELQWPAYDMKNASYKLTRRDIDETRLYPNSLINDRWSIEDMQQAGLTGKNLPAWWSLGDFLSAGLSLTDLRDVGLPAEQFKKAGISLQDLLMATWTLRDLMASEWPAEDLREEGWTPARALKDGYSPDVALYLKGTVTDFEEAGWSPARGLEAGWPLADMVKIWSPAQLIQQGYTIERILSDGSYKLENFQNTGWPADDFKEAGITLAQLKKINWPFLDLQRSGWTVQELLAAGYSAADLIVFGWAPTNLIRAGVTATTVKYKRHVWAMLNNSWPAVDLRTAGYKFDVDDISSRDDWTIKKFMDAGWIPDELIDGGLTAEKMKRFSWTLEGLKESGWTNAQLARAGWPEEELLHTAGTAAEDLVHYDQA